MKLLIPVAVLAGLYLVVVAAAYLAQDRLLYFPDSGGRERAEALGLVPWPEGEEPVGFVSRDPPDDPRATVLVWHGNAGSAPDRAYYVRALEPRGLRVVLMEYPGYGERSGKPGEAVFVADARAATRRAAERFGGPVWVLGESMGCGVATAVAADPECAVEGVVLITPWANLPDLAQSVYPFLPARLLARDRYDNVANLHRFSGPVAVALSAKDEVIPPPHGRRLYESIRSPKRLLEWEDAGHNSWPSAPEAPWWDEVVEFLTRPPAG